MNRPCYSDYVRHHLRHYCRNVPFKPEHLTEADLLAWKACEEAFSLLELVTRQIIQFVYGGYDTIPDNIYRASHIYEKDQDEIWHLMKKFEKLVAMKRGLI